MFSIKDISEYWSLLPVAPLCPLVYNIREDLQKRTILCIFASVEKLEESMDDKHYILSLIKEGEHQQQDFKYRVSDACKSASIGIGLCQYRWRPTADRCTR